MTIAACHVSPEGVISGADSTTTIGVPDGLRHYNFAQKIFEIGQPSTLGIVAWGLGGLPARSYRTLIAEFADALITGKQLASVAEVAAQWAEHFWKAYSTAWSVPISRTKNLDSKGTGRTSDEEKEYQGLLQGLSGGFCIGGNLLHAREPQAFECTFGPLMDKSNPPAQVPVGDMRFYGCPNLLLRLFRGADPEFIARLQNSPHWKGTAADIDDLQKPSLLLPPGHLPLREAIDWVHAAIYTTIKMMKFSRMAPVCGGPVEVAVITSDRHFRWVRHKPLGAAVEIGGSSHDTRHPTTTAVF